ncbi:MAG: hypothetical protein ACFB50_10260 [Rubrobacteraceae bacterium]
MEVTSRVYPNRGSFQAAVYDIRIPGVAERLHRERAMWAEYADIEALDANHYVLLIYPGAAVGVEK